jgi:glutamyl-tRNA synthetase
VGSARTFIFNWLYARHNHGTMVLRLDDTDVERNTEASVQSIFEGLRWLGLDWDEEYKQSERLALHRQQAEAIFAKGLAYRDFTPAHAGDDNQSGAQGAWLFNPGMRELSREESDRRAAAGEPFALRYRVPRGQGRTLRFTDASTASSPSWPTRSKTSPCCGRTECPPTTSPPASTTPICASATSSAARIT